MFDLLTWWRARRRERLNTELQSLTKRQAEKRLRALGMSQRGAKRYLSELPRNSS